MISTDIDDLGGNGHRWGMMCASALLALEPGDKVSLTEVDRGSTQHCKRNGLYTYSTFQVFAVGRRVVEP